MTKNLNKSDQHGIMVPRTNETTLQIMNNPKLGIISIKPKRNVQKKYRGQTLRESRRIKIILSIKMG